MSAARATLRVFAPSFIIVPARLASTRLPRKLLLKETGRSVLQHTFEAAAQASRPRGICIAADHEEIAVEAAMFGARVEMTDPSCPSGTDRVAEVARRLPEAEIICNVQGDEPEIEPAAIDLAIGLLEANPSAVMSTLATPIRTREKLFDPACVKVVFDAHQRAMYFSRAPIPYPRDWRDELLAAEPPLFHQHVGLYCYRRDFLLRLASIPRADIERTENLEQLRVLAAGESILVGVIPHAPKGIDTPEDYAAFVARITRA